MKRQIQNSSKIQTKMKVKKFYQLFLAATLMLCITSVKAQNRYQFGDGKTFFKTIQTSDNQIVSKSGDNAITIISKVKNNPILTEGKAVYTLTIAPEGEWILIVVNSDEGYEFEQYFWDGPFEQEVSEGNYDIVVWGYSEDYTTAILAYDQFEVSGDTVFNPSMNEATNYIHLDGYDENGTPFAELPMDTMSLEVSTYFVMSHGSTVLKNEYGFFTADQLNEPNNTGLLFNDFGNRSTIYNEVFFTTEDQKAYYVHFPTITEGINGNHTSANNPQDLFSHEEYYNINNPDSAYFSLVLYYLGPQPESFGWGFSLGYWQTYDPYQPLTVVTNSKVSDEPLTVGGTLMKFMVAPIVYESYDWYSPSLFDESFVDAMALFPYALNDDGQVICEPYGYFLKTGFFEASFPEHIPYTPAMYTYNPEKILTFGYRTPMLYQHAISMNTYNSPNGESFFGGKTGYLGEGGVQRMKDEDRILKITYNGLEYFNDSLFLANNNVANFVVSGEIEYEIVNDNLVVDGIAKTNTARISYDMNRTDGVPPTLTLLQVLNCVNDESIVVDYGGKMNFAAGDFNADLEMYGNYVLYGIQVYEKAANIELYYKTVGSEYQPLEFTENVDMFHINYGNFYEVPLEQLAGKVDNQWVTVKFVITDEEGNLQEQELQNLFYVDDGVHVDKTIGLSHSVYPNPFSNEVRINTTKAVNGTAQVNLYNVLGLQVYSENISCNGTTEFVIDGSNLKSGIYFYNIVTENGNMQGRIVRK